MNWKKLNVSCLVDFDIYKQKNLKKANSSRVFHDLEVIRAVRDLCGDIVIIPVERGKLFSLAELDIRRPDLVFNLSLPAFGEEPGIVSVLEHLSIPFTGSGSCAMVLTRNRLRSAQLLASNGISVPTIRAISRPTGLAPSASPPWIVKLLHSAGSAGLSKSNVVFCPREIAVVAQRMTRNYGLPLVCEEFIVGKEFRVYLVQRGKDLLPVAVSEWVFPASANGFGITTSRIKGNKHYRQSMGIKSQIAILSRRKRTELSEIAIKTAHILGIEGYAAIDMRVDAAGNAYVIDANANPGLSSTSVGWSCPSFAGNLTTIAEAALHKAR